MKNEICLDIKDFGPIGDAEIKLNNINVIAGINGSGKSISSKLLYCFLIAASNEGNYLVNNWIYQRFYDFILRYYDKILQSQSDDAINGILTLIDDQIDLKDNGFFKKRIMLLKDIICNLEFPDKEKFFEELKDIEEISNLNDGEYYFNVTNVLLNSEFNFSQLTDYKKAYIHFYGKINDCKFSHEIDFKCKKICVKISDGEIYCLNFNDIVYIDSSSLFDLNYEDIDNSNRIIRHLKYVNELSSIENQNEHHQKIEKYLDSFRNLINGEIYYDYQKQEFIFKQGNNQYSMKNTASGIKQIGIISLLLENRALKEDSFLIMDEPELNLHPEWQVRLAEMLVLLVKELNIYLYINSHSPQFIEALEVFSAKYGLRDDCKFYLSKKVNGKFSFIDIERKNLQILYDDLGNPYDAIDEIRTENFVNGIN